MAQTTVYIVTALRWGNQSEHSYNLGVFTKKQKAINCAESHCNYRGGKYACVVYECVIDNYDEDNSPKEIYRAKSQLG